MIRGGDFIPTLATGVAKLPVPRPERLYYSFGERVPTKDMPAGKASEWKIREKVAESIEQQLLELKQYRTEDREHNWGWLRKKITA